MPPPAGFATARHPVGSLAYRSSTASGRPACRSDHSLLALVPGRHSAHPRVRRRERQLGLHDDRGAPGHARRVHHPGPAARGVQQHLRRLPRQPRRLRAGHRRQRRRAHRRDSSRCRTLERRPSSSSRRVPPSAAVAEAAPGRRSVTQSIIGRKTARNTLLRKWSVVLLRSDPTRSETLAAERCGDRDADPAAILAFTDDPEVRDLSSSWRSPRGSASAAPAPTPRRGDSRSRAAGPGAGRPRHAVAGGDQVPAGASGRAARGRSPASPITASNDPMLAVSVDASIFYKPDLDGIDAAIARLFWPDDAR